MAEEEIFPSSALVRTLVINIVDTPTKNDSIGLVVYGYTQTSELTINNFPSI